MHVYIYISKINSCFLIPFEDKKKDENPNIFNIPDFWNPWEAQEWRWEPAKMQHTCVLRRFRHNIYIYMYFKLYKYIYTDTIYYVQLKKSLYMYIYICKYIHTSQRTTTNGWHILGPSPARKALLLPVPSRPAASPQ